MMKFVNLLSFLRWLTQDRDSKIKEIKKEDIRRLILMHRYFRSCVQPFRHAACLLVGFVCVCVC